MLNRRRALAAGAALLGRHGMAAGAVGARRAARPATLDWAILETLLAIGAPPVASTELVQFREVAVEPAVPDTVADLGLRGLPNFETLLLARPDIIFNSNFYASSVPLLVRIAPVESFAHLRARQAALRRRGRDDPRHRRPSRRAEVAEAFIARTHSDMATLRAPGSVGQRAVLPINLGDARISAPSASTACLAQRWSNSASPVPGRRRPAIRRPLLSGFEALAGYDNAWIALIGPTPPEVGPVLARSAFWNALPAVRAGRVLDLGPVNPFGALPAWRASPGC